jgi:hypothetical protein
MRPAELSHVYMSDPIQLRMFADKVARLRAEGLAVHVIATRLGVPPATIYGRLRKLRRMA